MCSQCEKEFFTDDWDILVALRTELATEKAARVALAEQVESLKREQNTLKRMDEMCGRS